MILLLLFLNSISVFADPIAIQCDKEGALIDSAYSVSLLKRQAEYVGNFDARNTQAGTCEKCHEVCQNNSNLQDLSSVSGSLASLPKTQSKGTSGPFSAISAEQFQALKIAESRFSTEELCRSKIPEQNKFKIADALAIFYPHETNWMYVTGCRSLKVKKCEPHFLKSLENAIHESVAMGVDPYAVIAKGLLENGVSGADSLYLDPVGAMDSMGCKGSPAKTGGDKTLNSYGTYYTYGEQVVQNDRIGKSLEKMMSHRGLKPQAKTSYLCRDVLSSEGSVHSAPQKNSCCLKLPFHAESVDEQGAITRGLVYEQMRKTLANRFRKTNDPAFRLQRFNGYTDLMGGAEPVPAFRAGVNFYKEPAYGYQGLDFILNSLLINPVLKEFVKTAEDKFGKTKSLICAENGEGNFLIDSDTYFDQHKNAKRFEGLKEKLKAGKELTNREQYVLEDELSNPEVAKALNRTDIKTRSNSQILGLLKRKGVHLDTQEAIPFQKALSTYDSEVVKKISSADLKILEKNHEDLSKISLQFGENFFDRYREVAQIVGQEHRRFGIAQKFAERLDNENLEGSPQRLREGLPIESQKKIEAELIELEKMNKLMFAKKRLQNAQKEVLKKYGGTYSPPTITNLNDREKLIERAKLTPRQKSDPEIIALIEEITKPDSTFGGEEQKVRWKKYFEEIHSTRDTVSKASTYSWTPLSAEKMKSLAKAYEASVK